MVNSIEFQCIEKANIARATLAKLQLVALREKGLTADTILIGIKFSEIKFSDYWQGGMLVKIKRTLLLPIALIAFILVDVLTVGVNMRETHIEKRKLQAKILKEKIIPKNLESPKTKTLASLWQLHGLSERACTNEERLQLLSEWIEILYGESIAKGVNLNQRLETIMSMHAIANRPYYDDESGAAHFYFGPPVDCLISELSEELPEYV